MKSPGESPRRSPRAGAAAPGHEEWEVLCAMLHEGRLLTAYQDSGDAGSVTRCVLSAGASPLATPVAKRVFLSLLSRGWVARRSSHAVDAVRATSYRLSLRGWYALRRVRPDLTASLTPGCLKKAQLP